MALRDEKCNPDCDANEPSAKTSLIVDIVYCRLFEIFENS